LPVSAWLLHRTQFLSLFFCILGVFIILRHRSNIQRLIAGTESKFAKKKPESEAGK
jgi:acyl phosphate:glycerol-3-phosphate acyltransferase